MDHLLDRVRSDERSPAAGSAGTATAALATALVMKAARRSRAVWPEAGGAIAQAAALETRLWAAGDELERTYRRAVEALESGDQEAIGEFVPAAADASLELARIAADVAELAVDAAHHCDQAHHADVTVAAILATAASRTGAQLVAVNLLSRPDDARSSEARLLVERAQAAAEMLASER
ncbi:MAG TPA: cyclodeaminase/cyclohydrolase family protein [Gaiellales bacterium]|nr:cyclodeaminase/cyclohydrolase family protein [Gaiellales bacterium]